MDGKWTKVRDGVFQRFGKHSIWRFRDEHYFLSNMFMTTGLSVDFEGLAFPSSEHAYVAAKTLDRKVRQEIAETESPGDAKRYGQILDLREDWDEIKEQAMLDVLRSKFSLELHPDLVRQLLQTGERPLVEGNVWDDRLWGMAVRNGELQGENRLGELLMQVRRELADGCRPQTEARLAKPQLEQLRVATAQPGGPGVPAAPPSALEEASGEALPNELLAWLRLAISEEVPAEDVESLVAAVEVILSGADEDVEAVCSAAEILRCSGAPCCADRL